MQWRVGSGPRHLPAALHRIGVLVNSIHMTARPPEAIVGVAQRSQRIPLVVQDGGAPGQEIALLHMRNTEIAGRQHGAIAHTSKLQPLALCDGVMQWLGPTEKNMGFARRSLWRDKMGIGSREAGTCCHWDLRLAVRHDCSHEIGHPCAPPDVIGLARRVWSPMIPSNIGQEQEDLWPIRFHDCCDIGYLARLPLIGIR